MKVGILTSERSSTYVYSLVSGLYDLGFFELKIIRLPQNSQGMSSNNFAKFRSYSLWICLLKVIERVKACSIWKLKGITNNINRLIIDIRTEKDLIKLISEEKFKILIAYNSGLLNNEILSLPGVDVICAHPALLPFGRGFHGHLQSILSGVPLGVTVFKVDRGIDTGDIYIQEELDVSKCKSTYDLKRDFFKKELDLTLKTVSGISSSSLVPRKQGRRRKYWKLTKQETDQARQMLDSIFRQNKIRLSQRAQRRG